MAKPGKRRRKAPPRARRIPVAPRRSGGERLELAMRAINEGVYDWDVSSGEVHYSEGVYAVLHMPRSMKTPADWRARIHPDDLAAYDAAILAHFKGKTERFECDYRFRDRKGGWRWARQHGIATRDARGRAVRMVGSTGDISELKRVEQALQESEQRYALATQAATEGIYEWNLETGSLYLSDRSKAFFAVAGDALTPAVWNSRVHGEDFQGYRDKIVRYFKGRSKHFEHEYRIRNASGGYSWVVDRAVAVRNDAGRAIRLVGALSDVTQRKLHEIELQRARDEATEGLERQTATAEILKVISSSPTDVQPVLDAIVASAARLFDPCNAIIIMREGDLLHRKASAGPRVSQEDPDELARIYPLPFDPDRSISARAIAERRTIESPDTAGPEVSAYAKKLRRAARFRSATHVPLLREGEGIGTIVLTHPESGFRLTERQLALVQTFADQAVIAIENVRLFHELQERNQALSVSLDRQTATAEILRVISRSQTDVQPVFEAIADSAMRLLKAWSAGVFLFDGEMLHFGAARGSLPDTDDYVSKRYPMRPGSGSMSARCIQERAACQLSDVLTDPDPGLREMARARRYRAVLAVPMLRNGEPIGTISATRTDPGAFPESEVELLKTFADQAVIAIENVRLFNETKEALDQQRATAEVLESISGSMTDTQPVFVRIVQNLSRLFGTRFAVLQLLRGDQVEMPAVDGGPEFNRLRERYPRPLDDTTVGGRAMLSRRTVHVTPVLGNPETPAATVQFARDFGFNSVIFTPMVHEGEVIGAIGAAFPEAKPFSERQIALIKTFADQAVIAIQNARLFNETREALERQTATADILRVISSSPTDTHPVFEAIVRSCQRLFSGHSVALALVADGQIAAKAGVDASGAPFDLDALPPWALDRGSATGDRKSTRLNSSHIQKSRMPSSA